jgi:hypothetical protein
VGTSTGHGTILERTSKLQPKRVHVIVNQSIVNRGLMRNVQNWLIDANRLMQWLQDPSELNEDNPSDVRREDSRHCRNKKREYLKGKINELGSNSKNKNIRDLYRGTGEFKKGYKRRIKLLKTRGATYLRILTKF